MEEDQEQRKHVCKSCNQSFSSGKSLGGHMRAHLANNDSNKMGSDEDGGDQSGGYILRDNPKKSWRFSDSSHGGSKGEHHQCRICGKGFPTERALSGHMRHHSRKERAKNYCKECGKGFGSLKALFGHMRCHSDLYRPVDKQSEDESTSSLTMPKRPRTKRYKITANSFASDFNAYSCDAEIAPEVEEVAMILMMLSRGVRVWGAVDSITECFLGGKLLNPDKGVTENGGGSLACNGDQGFKMKIPIKTCDSDDGDVMLGEEVSEFGDLGSAIVSNEEEKVELEDTIRGFLRSDELKRSNLENATRNELPDTEMVNATVDEVELSKKSAKESGSDRAGSESRKLKSRKKARVDAYDPELGGNSCGKMKCMSDYEVFVNKSCKKGEYSCRTCYKGFSTHQALGGHRARHHKAIKSSCVPKIKCSQKGIHTSLLSTDVETNGKLLLAKPERASNSVELEHEAGGTIVISCELKKSKAHECPICFKVFASGQALGGHMRAHCAGSTCPSEQQHSDNHDVFDVNLLDTLGEDADGHVGLKPWWVGSDNKHEQLVGLLS